MYVRIPAPRRHEHFLTLLRRLSHDNGLFLRQSLILRTLRPDCLAIDLAQLEIIVLNVWPADIPCKFLLSVEQNVGATAGYNGSA